MAQQDTLSIQNVSLLQINIFNNSNTKELHHQCSYFVFKQFKNINFQGARMFWASSLLPV